MQTKLYSQTVATENVDCTYYRDVVGNANHDLPKHISDDSCRYDKERTSFFLSGRGGNLSTDQNVTAINFFFDIDLCQDSFYEEVSCNHMIS